MVFEYLFEIGPWSELSKPNSGSSGKFVSLTDEVFVDIFELIVLFLHSTHSDDGAIEHFLEHGDIVFEEFEFR